MGSGVDSALGWAFQLVASGDLLEAIMDFAKALASGVYRSMRAHADPASAIQWARAAPKEGWQGQD